MNRFARRRIVHATIAVVIVVALAWLVQWQTQTMQHASFATGYLLLTAVVYLAAYNLRKKLTMLPIGAMSHWLQAHIYVGFIAIAFFLLHIQFRWPNGILESVLAGLFTLTASSGLYGLVISRRLPGQLRKLREEFIYERIPALREQVRVQAHALVIGLLQGADAPTVSDFYLHRLAPFFERSRSAWYYLRPSSRLRNQLRADLLDLDRYFSTQEREASQQISQLIDRRDDLDYSDALQQQLKIWLFVHIGLTYALLIVATWHGVLAHAFYGGMR